jgi:hypothetical protein
VKSWHREEGDDGVEGVDGVGCGEFTEEDKGVEGL